MNEGSIRVLVVDDQRLVAEAFAENLNQEPDLHLVGVAGDEPAAMQAIEEQRPHVVLLDYMLPLTEGPDVAARIAQRWPEVRVLMVTGRTDEQARRRSLEAGCVGFVSKDVSTYELVSAVRAAAAGATVAVVPPPAPQPNATVTPRELEVLQMLADGRTTREIASSMFISYATTRNHIQHILHKLGAHSRLQAVAVATRQGLLAGVDGRPRTDP
jgi:DNA-binding NarL/FixJ family response regulator